MQVGVKIGLGENEDHVAVEQRVDGGNGPGQTVMTHLGHFLGLLPGQAGVGGDDPQGGVGVGIWLADNTLMADGGGGVGELTAVGSQASPGDDLCRWRNPGRLQRR